MNDLVPVEPLREAFERSGLTIAELARRLDVDHCTISRIVRPTVRYRYQVKSNGERVRYGPYYKKSVTYDNATAIARAIGVDPYEVGL